MGARGQKSAGNCRGEGRGSFHTTQCIVNAVGPAFRIRDSTRQNTPDFHIKNVVSYSRNQIAGRCGLHRHPHVNSPPHAHVPEFLVF